MRRYGALALTVAAIAFGLYVRFAGLPDVFCHSPDEFSEIMPGLRLHALPFPGLDRPVRYGFVPSMFYSQHGLGDVSFYYLASAALSGAGLPVSERWLAAVGGIANLALIALGVTFAITVLDSAAAGWLFALLTLVSPFYVFVSKTGWARLSWTPMLLIALLLLQHRALQRPKRAATPAFWILALFVALTDACITLPVVPLAAWWETSGAWRDRLRTLRRNPAFVGGLLAMAAGLAVDVVLGVAAHRRHTDLTMIGYVLLRARGGSWMPTLGALRMWARCVDGYVPIPAGWVLALAAFALAVRDARRGSRIGIVAFWWALASVGIIRYASGGAEPGALNAYYIAPPTLLLVAWLIVRCPVAIGSVVAATLLIPFAIEAHVAAFDTAPRFGLRVEQLVHHTEMPVSTCRTIKAAAFYIRSRPPALPNVFHLSSDGWNVYLGHIAEFYDGLSYGRAADTDDPNHVFDFGEQRFGRQVPPEALAAAYGLPHFDYYIDFVDEPDRAGVKPATLARLQREGARVVVTIADRGRPIGRILAFSSEPPTTLEYADAAAGWDRTFARASTLLLQPIAGSAYHFGYNWKTPE